MLILWLSKQTAQPPRRFEVKVLLVGGLGFIGKHVIRAIPPGYEISIMFKP